MTDIAHRTDAATRTVDGRTVPAPGTYTLDASHSTVEAVARHMVVTKVRGRFSDFTGTIVVDEEPTRSTVEVSIPAATIDTRNADRDGHLRSPDFLDVEQFPTIDFRSTAVRPVSADRWEVEGDLTIRGTTHPVTLAVDFLGTATDPWGGTRALFSAATKLEREAYGMTWNQALEAGGVLVSKVFDIELEVQAVRG